MVVLLIILVLFTSSMIYVNADEKHVVESVFILVMDGVRSSEGFGDPEHINIPYLWNDLKPLGAFYPNFRNEWITLTTPAHAAMLTGVYENLPNEYDKMIYPKFPTIFEYYRKQTGAPAEKCWIVAQHRNLMKNGQSVHPEYGEQYGAKVDCPMLHTNKTGETDDRAMFRMLIGVIDEHHPNLVMVNFGYIDEIAHKGDWNGYINAIKDADRMIWELWNKLQSNSYYKGKTAIFVTADHGRHLDNVWGNVNASDPPWKRGKPVPWRNALGQLITVYPWMVHGDSCEGCRSIFLLAIGPGIKHDTVITAPREQKDIAPTVGELMGFSTPLAEGKAMFEMLTENSRSQKNILPEIDVYFTVPILIAILGSVVFAILLRKKICALSV